MRLALSISTCLDRFLDRLLPHGCLLCGATSRQALCSGCLDDLPPLRGPQCPRCAAPLVAAAPCCAGCLKRPPAYDATVARWEYAYPLDHLVVELKFARRLANADFFATALLAGDRPEGDLIVPVPLSARHLRERGFNQAVEIARPLSRALGLPLALDLLSRPADTAPQSRLPWRARHANVRHAFVCHQALGGKDVIVVDDVMTTGATLDAVARTLKDHGAGRVTNWVVARAVKRLT